jgi:hypothetical protein
VGRRVLSSVKWWASASSDVEVGLGRRSHQRKERRTVNGRGSQSRKCGSAGVEVEREERGEEVPARASMPAVVWKSSSSTLRVTMTAVKAMSGM